MNHRAAVALAAALLLSGCHMGAFGLDRLAGLPTAPYDKGPTLSGHTQIRMVPPEQVDPLCRQVQQQLPPSLRAAPLKSGQYYRECYDPWNDVGYVPLYPSKAEQQRLYEHMLGHARGGTHADGAGRTPWYEAAWARFYKPALPGN